MKRTLEMAVCYSDGTWDDGHFVGIDDPGELDETQLERLGREALQAQLDAGSFIKKFVITGMWLYNSGEETKEELPRRTEVQVKL